MGRAARYGPGRLCRCAQGACANGPERSSPVSVILRICAINPAALGFLIVLHNLAQGLAARLRNFWLEIVEEFSVAGSILSKTSRC